MPDHDIYLKLDGLPGGSRDRYHVGWIKLESFQWAPGGSASPHGSGRSPAKEIVLTKLTDGSSATLMKASTGGEAFRSGVVELTDPVTKRPKVRFDFTDLLVAVYNNPRSSGGATKLTDELTLNFTNVTVNFNPVVDDDALDKMLKAFGLIK